VISIPFIVTNVTAEVVPWLVVTVMGVFQMGIAYVLFSIGIKTTPPLAASLIAVIEPLLSPVWVMLATGEKPGPYAVAGGVIVLAAVVAYNAITARRERREAAGPSDLDAGKNTFNA
jgi:drug/metabolite transporter (DMT)-like permease